MSSRMYSSRSSVGASITEERRLLDAASQLLSQYLAANVRESPAEYDLLAQLPDGTTLAVEVKRVRDGRVAAITGAMSRAVLQLRKWLPRGGQGMVLVHVPRLGARGMAAVDGFMTDYAGSVGWGVFDGAGRVRLRWGGVNIDQDEGRSTVAATTDRRNRNLFTDLNRWLLKVLLYQDWRRVHWGGPIGRVRNPRQLSELAGVSTEKAYRFTRTFMERGYVSRERGQLQLTEVPSLLRDWVAAELATVHNAVPVRNLFPGPLDVGHLCQLLEARGLEVAVGGFAAAEHHRTLIVPRRPPVVHVGGRADEVIQIADLLPAESDSHDLIISRPRYPKSVFRATSRIDGLPVVDTWQAALDVVHRAARGLEQSEHIMEYLLG